VKRIVFCEDETVKVTLAKGQTRRKAGTQSFRSKGCKTAYDSGVADNLSRRSSVDRDSCCIDLIAREPFRV
jgi:hypothetical protein